jgi:hypothetical protein
MAYIGSTPAPQMPEVGTGAVETQDIQDGAVTAAKLAPGAAVPSQTGNSAKYLTTDGTTSSWGLAVASFNTRTGAVTLSSGDVTGALGFTPYNSTNPSGYISSITGSNVTTALGFTPYNATNPNGYISSITSGNVTTALGFTPYNATNPSGYTTNTGTVTNVGGTGTVSGLTLTGSVSTTGNLTLGGTLSLTSGNVTTALGFTPENTANRGVANGYASLDGSGLVPSTQLPSYVDDVLEYANLAGFPATGTTGKIYVAIDTNKTYRWSGSAYIYITSGAVDSVAGKTGVVSLTNADVGLGNVENKSSATIRSEISSANVTTALGFTPYNSTNPSGYITGITSANVTTALGFTPYNSSNPSGYVTSSALSSYLPLAGGQMSGTLSFQQPVGLNFANGQYIKDNSAAGLVLYSTYQINLNADTFTTATNSIRAPLFYDSNDTGYYLDPANFSNLNQATFQSYIGLGGNGPTTNMSGTSGVSIYHANYPSVGFSTAAGPNYLIYRQGSGGPLAVWNSTGNETFLFQPTYTQSLKNITIGSTTVAPNRQLTFSSVNEDAIQIRRLTTSQGAPAAGTGISWTWTSAGTDTETWAAIRAIMPGSGNSFLSFSTTPTSGGGAGLTERLNIADSGVVTANVDIRSPIFYDSNDTGYYVNPNSFSQLSYANLNASPGGRTLSLGGDQTDRVYNDSARAGLVINATSYPHLYINATTNISNPHHGAVFSMTGNLTGGGYRRWGMGIANTDPDCFSWGYADNNTNPHYGVGGVFGYTGTDSKMWLNTAGSLWARGDMRSPIFYDSNDTGYYVDANSGSRLAHIFAGNVNSSNDGGWNARFNLVGSAHARMDVVSNSDGIITTMYSHTGQGVGRVGTYSNHPLILMADGGQEGGRVYNGSLRAPIFYDLNNTDYYLDPAGTSVLNNLSGPALNDSQLWLRGKGDTNHYLWNNADDYEELVMYFGTGFRVTNSNGNGTLLHCYGSTNGNHVYTPTSFRAPIFYDSDNTSYYVDPSNYTSLYGGLQVLGAHSSTRSLLQLPAGNNGAATGVVALTSWCSEPGISWDYAGFGYNAINDGGTPSGFSRINPNFGQAYMRFSPSGSLIFYNTPTSGSNYTTMALNSFGDVITYQNLYTRRMYDLDNTDYHVNPASTTNLNVLTLNGVAVTAGGGGGAPFAAFGANGP